MELLKTRLPGDDEGELSPEVTMDDIREAVGTIEKRSQGLLHFVDAYRNLTHIPRPDFPAVPWSKSCSPACKH